MDCVPCSCAVDELRNLNASLRTLIGPGALAGAGGMLGPASMARNAAPDSETTIIVNCAGRTRSIIMFLGPLLHRSADFQLPYAGGCDLGTRTVEPHMSALRPFGLDVKATDGSYHAMVQPGIVPTRPVAPRSRSTSRGCSARTSSPTPTPPPSTPPAATAAKPPSRPPACTTR